MTFVIQVKEDYEDALWTDAYYIDVHPARLRQFVESVEQGHDPFRVRYRQVEFVPPDAKTRTFAGYRKAS